jgi:hypothetical protein
VQKGFIRRGAEDLPRHNPDSAGPASADEAAPADSKKRKRGATEDAIRKGLEGFFKR